jgi:hypothetical protein
MALSESSLNHIFSGNFRNYSTRSKDVRIIDGHLPCNIVEIRSSPIPVSILVWGEGHNTGFILIKLGKDQIPDFYETACITPGSQLVYRSHIALQIIMQLTVCMHGPELPAGPQKLSFFPNLMIRLTGTPMSLFQILNASSSSV